MLETTLHFRKSDAHTFGGDNYYYLAKNSDGTKDEYIVCCGWGLLAPSTATIIKNGIPIQFLVRAGKRISPKLALRTIGLRIRKESTHVGDF